MQITRKLVAVVVTLAVAGALVAGCGSSNTTTVRQNIVERVGWNAALPQMAFAAPGATGLLYVWRMSENGGGMALLTPSVSNANPPLEGGDNPAYKPDGSELAIISERGTTPSIYLINATLGERSLFQRVTSNTGPLGGNGKDEEPNWNPSETALIYASTRPDNNYDIRTVNADGTGISELIATAADEKWPCYNPANADQVVYQAGPAGDENHADIMLYTISTSATTNLTNAASFLNGAPSWSPADESSQAWIAFHSDRGGTFDIWKMHPDGSSLTQLTNDGRSDGYPIWKKMADGTLRIAFTRNREVWTMKADGTDQKQITTRPTS